MPDTRPSRLTDRLPASLLLTTAAASLLFSGCKPGHTDSYSSTAQAAPVVAAQREDSAISSFRRAFGDSSAAPDTSPAPGSSGSDTLPSSQPPMEARPTLSWTAPLTRENGQSLPMSEISGYRVHYRLRHLEDVQSVMMEGADNTRLPLDQFEPGAYEFSVSVVDSEGLESAPSDTVAVDLI